ncbi:MAG: RagB/SusD family nutrient uptake outer membrane protein [Bacteroidales bacterium]|nr:RagB/SusD family nutrient uptake outer membrane protein [Bacteroidales bacterium]
MKKIFLHTLIGIAAIATLTGCWGLDYDNPSAVTEDSFLDRASDLDKLMTATYAQMKRAYCFGYDFVFDAVTDIAIGDIQQNYMMGQASLNDSWIQNCWQQTYNMANYANSAIRNLQNVEAVDPSDPDAAGRITTTSRNQAIAECKFLRALAYFRLINLYGDIPYYDETWDTAETFMDRFVVPSSAAEVRAKIIADLDEAIATLPDAWPASSYGRATKTAAYAVRGKVKLFAGDYSSAASDFEWVISNGRSGQTAVSLDPSFRHLFRVFGVGSRSPEMIFSIQNSATNGMATTTLMGNKASLRQIPTDRMNPSPKLVDLYEKLDGSKFDWDEYLPGWNNATPAKRKEMTAVTLKTDANGLAYIDDLLQSDTSAMARAYRERDPRLGVSCITPYSTYLGTTAGSIAQTFNYWLVDASKTTTAAGVGNGTMINFNGAFTPSYFVRKFVIEGAETGGEYSNAPYEWPVIRLGDVMLMLAECYNETGNDAKACDYVNKVRERVGMPGINKSGNDLRQYIRDERARELAFEGHRFFDLRRWGISSQVIPGDAKTIWGEKIYTAAYPGKYDIWPIPSVEIDRTPDFAAYQKQGW